MRTAISGNIAVGKTTLVTKLAAHYGLPEYTEPIDGTLLEFFYEAKAGKEFLDDNGVAVPISEVEKLSQIAFLYNNLLREMKSLLGSKGGFYDRTLAEHLHIFAKANLSRFDYNAFCGFQHSNFNFFKMIPRYDMIIILTCDVEVMKQRLKKRNRSSEVGISDEYLHKLNDLYNHEDFVLDSQMFSDLVIKVDVSNLNEDEVFEKVVEQVDLYTTYKDGVTSSYSIHGALFKQPGDTTLMVEED